jgi:hypothetical protein
MEKLNQTSTLLPEFGAEKRLALNGDIQKGFY